MTTVKMVIDGAAHEVECAGDEMTYDGDAYYASPEYRVWPRLEEDEFHVERGAGVPEKHRTTLYEVMEGSRVMGWAWVDAWTGHLLTACYGSARDSLVCLLVLRCVAEGKMRPR